ncbi:MAG: LysR family transcriptional regulator, partial [Corynebacterium sp.]|nr:LysR family transcriptional regulator [Corynebacterium sp.]
LFNAIHMVKQSIGSALCIDGLVAADDPSLTFIPLHPRMESRLHLAWKTDRHLNPLEQLFVDQLEATMAGMSER